MSEIPPQDPAGPGAQPTYVGYTRPGAVYGSADKLKALADGYSGLGTVFLINVVWAIAMNGVASVALPGMGWSLLLASAVATAGLIGLLVYPKNKLIAYGANWNPNSATIATVLMAINSAVCCGIVGYLVMQALAMGELKKYGLRASLFGLKKPEVEAAIQRLQAAQSAPPPPAVPPA